MVIRAEGQRVLVAKAEENQSKESGPEEHASTKCGEPDSLGEWLLIRADF